MDKQKRDILEVFVTSADDPIYAINSNVPPEVFGAFGSYFSRNPKDFREHLWKALTGQVEEQETEVKSKSLEWLANRDFRTPADAIQKGLAKSQDFFKKWYGKYSHKSIANTVWIPMVATNASQLFARELAYDQLAFFIEQSTRYVKWGLDNMFLDKDVMQSNHAVTFKSTIEMLAKSYHTVTDQAITHYQNTIPFDTWRGWQTDATLKQPYESQKVKYNREIQGAALDRARFLLPQACQTNIAWILDARSTEFDIATWKGHPLREIREAAHLVEKHAGQIAPSLLKYTEENPYYIDKLHDYYNNLFAPAPERFSKGIDIISHDPDALDKTIAHLLKRHNRGGTFRQRYEEAKNLGFNQKVLLLKRAVSKREKYDEWVEQDEDFDLVKLTFEIKTDIGATRDWRRHQKWDRGEPSYTLDNGFHRPELIDRMGPDSVNLFNNAMVQAHIAEKTIRKSFPFQAQYIIPMAANHAITMSAGLDQLQYMLYTRTTPQANFSYREDAFNLAEAVARTHPWMLGYEQYPEGKPFLQVYDEAPLKDLMPLQLEESALHQ
jgi:thymidylate synthase ThyX